MHWYNIMNKPHKLFLIDVLKILIGIGIQDILLAPYIIVEYLQQWEHIHGHHVIGGMNWHWRSSRKGSWDQLQ